ncbi:MAG: hypothetical protein AAF601_05110 [Pseudomonadota bacterium]
MKDGATARRNDVQVRLSDVAELILDRFEQMEFAFAEAHEATCEATRALRDATAVLQARPAPASVIEARIEDIASKIDGLAARINATHAAEAPGMDQPQENSGPVSDDLQTKDVLQAVTDLAHANRALASGAVGPDLTQMHEEFLNDLRLAVAECLAQVLKPQAEEGQRRDVP